MLSRYRSCALAALLIAARDDRTDAFTATRPAGVARTSSITAERRRQRHSPAASAPPSSRLGLSLNPDWDNGDFLSSLGGGEDEMKAANDAYHAQSEKRHEEDEWKLRMMEQRKRAEARTREQQSGQRTGAGPSPDLLAKMGVGQQPQVRWLLVSREIEATYIFKSPELSELASCPIFKDVTYLLSLQPIKLIA